MRQFLLALCSCLIAGSLWAQDRWQDLSLEELLGRTPGTMLDQLRDDPAGFVKEAAGVVLGYGTAQGISPAELEEVVGAARAQVRARELRRLLSADLNNDLALIPRERQVAIAGASATMRGRLFGWFSLADSDNDGTISWTEIRNFAEGRATEALTPERAEAIRRLMIFDLNGNGRVTVEELKEAVTLLSRES